MANSSFLLPILVLFVVLFLVDNASGAWPERSSRASRWKESNRAKVEAMSRKSKHHSVVNSAINATAKAATNVGLSAYGVNGTAKKLATPIVKEVVKHQLYNMADSAGDAWKRGQQSAAKNPGFI